MTGCKTDEAREFYLRLCIANRYTKRELDRQIGSMLYERTMISHEKHKDLLAGNGGLAALRDSYVFEFLDLEEPYKEKDLRRQIVSHLKDFIIEFGHDFTFVGEEYRVQVGNTDFFIDLLFYNRALSCLVAIKLKIQSRKHCRKTNGVSRAGTGGRRAASGIHPDAAGISGRAGGHSCRQPASRNPLPGLRLRGAPTPGGAV